MKLLDAQEIKEEKTKAIESRLDKVKKLSLEELRLTKSINSLRLEEKKVKEHNKSLILDNEATLKVKKSVLQNEVDILESRKSIALTPIKIQQDKLDKEKKELEEQSKLLIQLKNDTKKTRESLIEKIESLDDKKDLLKSLEITLNHRSSSISAAEKEIKRSTEELGKKWVEFHLEVSNKLEQLNSTEKELLDREKQIKYDKEINESIRLSNKAESDRLTQERRSIHDSYIALEQAKKHLNIK